MFYLTELPASAAQDPTQMAKSMTSAVSKTSAVMTRPVMSVTPLGTSAISTSQHFTAHSSPLMFTMPSSFTTSAMGIPTTSTMSSPSSIANTGSSLPTHFTQMTSPAGSCGSGGGDGFSPGKDRPPPLSFTAGPTNMSIDLGPPVNISDLPNSLSDLPFITMDWSDSDSNIQNLDLPDMLDTPNPLRTSLGPMGSPGSSSSRDAPDFLSVPTGSGSNHGGSVHGSEPNLSQLGFGDELQDQSAMNLDVSDWLDVIMPSSGLTPLSATAPMSFPSDPILTPKPQDVLELFNIEESDLYTPADLGASTFDKVMETATSKSWSPRGPLVPR